MQSKCHPLCKGLLSTRDPVLQQSRAGVAFCVGECCVAMVCGTQLPKINAVFVSFCGICWCVNRTVCFWELFSQCRYAIRYRFKKVWSRCTVGAQNRPALSNTEINAEFIILKTLCGINTKMTCTQSAVHAVHIEDTRHET